MTKIIEYITTNYTWFLGGAIIVVLAIIGYYADKTNFGQGKSKSKNNQDNKKQDKFELDKMTNDNLNEVEDEANPDIINAKEIFQENSLEDIPNDEYNNPDELNKEYYNIFDENNESINESKNQEVGYGFNPENVFSIVNDSNLTQNEDPLFSQELNNNDLEISNLVGDIQNQNNNILDNISNINQESQLYNNELTDPLINNEEKTNPELNFDLFASNDSEENKLKIPKNIEENQNNNQVDQTNFEKFDEQFNTIIPKKEIINSELLEDIDELSLDKSKKFTIDDIPDLDDVDLPEIRETKISENDIWKF